jgi:hypothetical protein
MAFATSSSNTAGQDNPDSNPKPSQHVDQGIRAEQVDPTAKEIADAGLPDAEDLRRLGLLEPSPLDRLLRGDNQVGTDQEVLGLLRGEA